jgi:hypothetical protein
VRNLLIPISVGFLSLSFSVVPAATAEVNAHSEGYFSPAAVNKEITSPEIEAEAHTIYNRCGLEAYGLSSAAFSYAYEGYEKLIAENKIPRTGMITICDFSQGSGSKRLYIIDLENNKLVRNTWVAHGRNSGSVFATRFSNQPESLQSSLGFYVTRGTYIGKHGMSLKLDGLEPGINNNAMRRNIVVHGAAYVDPARARYGGGMGRSFGCPAVPQQESASIINTIKEGTCLFIYHPGVNYLHASKLLND